MATIEDPITCWVTELNGAMYWVQLVGCTLIVYQYLLSKPKLLWYVLLAHAIAGFLGVIMESGFLMHRDCQMSGNVALLLGFNEINWIIHESSTVVYSFIKFSTVIQSEKLKRAIQVILGILFVIFAALRINIGLLRVATNNVSSPAISMAHSWAFLAWGTADLILFVLLLLTARQNIETMSRSVINTLMQSSLPRIFFIILNTFFIVIVGQIMSPSVGVSNFNTMLWMIKGTYPLILLLDMKNTKEMLQSTLSKRGDKSESRRVSQSQTGQPIPLLRSPSKV